MPINLQTLHIETIFSYSMDSFYNIFLSNHMFSLFLIYLLHLFISQFLCRHIVFLFRNPFLLFLIKSLVASAKHLDSRRINTLRNYDNPLIRSAICPAIHLYSFSLPSLVSLCLLLSPSLSISVHVLFFIYCCDM